MDEQEEFRRVVMNTPRVTRDVLRVLSFLLDEVKGLSPNHTTKKKLNKNQLKERREQAAFDKSPEGQKLKAQRKNDRLERASSGEKTMGYMTRDGKMIAEPQVLNAETVNLDQLKSFLTKYELQFHIESFDDKTFELHFFAKDKELAAKALERAVKDLAKDPSQVTEKDKAAGFKEAKQKQDNIKQQHQAWQAEQQASKAASAVSKDSKEMFKEFTK